MKTIDLRSDTVTLPTPAMRQAIAAAPLGDDVFGEDPTINKLQQMAAEIMDKEAALLVASGTMGNLVSILTHCSRGDEVILGDQSHTFYYEVGGISALGGIQTHTIPNQPDGTLKLSDIAAAIRPDGSHFPSTKLICLENTQNRCGGVILKPDYMNSVAELAKQNNLKIHLDGARIFNATVALGTDVKELVKDADSVMFCLSKGLAAPVGSVICGSAEFIEKAHKIRKMVGGGMRQAGIIAAAGIIALEQMIDRLAEDHKNANKLARAIAQIKGFSINLNAVQTNIVYFDLDSENITAQQVVEKAKQKGILLLNLGGKTLRMVTHYGIESEDIETTISALSQIMKKLK
ncbi:L-allo-threonine aldolase [subsurface metagenome]